MIVGTVESISRIAGKPIIFYVDARRTKHIMFSANGLYPTVDVGDRLYITADRALSSINNTGASCSHGS